MAIDIRGLGNREAFSQIAKLAYGSGSSERIAGGKGNIGLLNGRVVKFNTHWSERGGKPSDEMRTCCNELRTRLSEIATAMLANRNDASTRALASVRRALGMDADGNQVETRKLLDRTAVATVMNVLRDATGYDVWGELRGGDTQSLSSKGIDTTFDRVAGDVRLSDAVLQHVRDAAAEIAHPADGKPGVVLDERATKFLADLVERDLREPGSREPPDLAEVVRGIRDFTSPYLIVTLQTFRLNSEVLARARPGIVAGEQATTFLAGSPRSQRADRADVSLALLADASRKNSGPRSGFAIALVSEKMPEMRRLQPKGRLTGATVWKACFGEDVPEGLADGYGSRAFSDAFFRRLFRMGDELLAQCGGLRDFPKFTFTQMSGLFLPRVFTGLTFTASIRLCAQDPTFTLDAGRDFVAAPPLYPVEDALVKTDDNVKQQLTGDFYRDTPTISLHDGDDAQVFDFAAAYADAHRDGDGPRAEGQPAPTPLARFRENVNEFVADFDALYGNRMTEAQRKVLLMGLTQAGLTPFAAIESLVERAHSKMQIDICRLDDGAFVISFMTDRERTDDLNVRYSYLVKPDGTNRRVDEFVYDVRLG